LNRRQFDKELAQACSQATTAQQSVAMLMVDVDYFKRYNDTYGHPAGDACLVQVSQVLRQLAHDHDGIAARLGGEEFALLLPGCTQDQAVDAGTALCERVRAASIVHSASAVAQHVTVSVGAAQLGPSDAGHAESLVKLADQALYQAKEAGRDRVCVADWPATANPTPAALLPVLCDANAESADVMIDAAGPVSDSPEVAYAQTLQSKFLWLRFPDEQEVDYQQEHAAQRRLLLLIMSVLGLGIYQLYLLSSLPMFSDLPGDALTVQMRFSAGVLIIALVSHKLPVSSSWWREALFSVCASLMAVMTLWLLSQSQQSTALSFAASLALVPLFAGAGARQPFWFTCVSGVITCAAAVWLLKPMGTEQSLILQDSLLMIVNNTVFALILAYTLEYGERKAWLLSNIERLQGQKLLEATRRLHELSTQDPLTGICNRRYFDAVFDGLWNESVQDRQPLAFLIIDVDYFKRYNDGYGHPAGDRCLQQVAATISQVAQTEQALVARLGGEEFGMLLPGGDTEQILKLGEQVCAAVRQAGIEHHYSQVPGHQIVTVSIGAASLLPAEGGNRRALVAMADDALYQAKNLGRNRVEALRVPQQARG
ncbi:MAG TPA: diguanylate cyclase, partial [Aquabacterium sp.]|nr:diguanylate cyclase [Aquabacterium sp.]